MSEKYTVIRTDLMSGVKQPADLVSIRFYGADGKVADVENGTIVKLVKLEDGEREVYHAVAASASDDLDECAVVAGVEVMYDERKKNLSEFVNEAGTITRAYLLRTNNVFSITKEGFVGGTVPAKGDSVGVGTGGKIDKAGSNLGACIDVEETARYTYYAIKIAKKAASTTTVTPGEGG